MNFKQFMEEQKPEILYFGCSPWDTGHYVFQPFAWTTRLSWHKDKNARFLADHDGKLAPKINKGQGSAALHHFPEFTILAWWDYTMDKRPGSNSMIMVPGNVTLEQALETLKSNFPEVWKRQTNPIAVTQ